jgi:hypothetical protein
MMTKRVAALSTGALMALMICSALPARAADLYLFDVLKQPAYRKAYLAMMKGATHLPVWLGQITGKGDYVATPETHATIDGVTYRLFNACKAHDCADNIFEVMFSPGGAPAYAVLTEDKNPKRWFGNPNAAQQKALTSAFE